MDADMTTPLLGQTTIVVASDPPLSGLQRFAINFFSLARLVRGVCFMVWPALILSSFDIPRNGGTFLLGSLLGSRDLLLGGLLLTADRFNRHEVRRALVTVLLSDAADTVILIFSAACSWHWKSPFIEIGLAAGFALLEHLLLWSMSEEEIRPGRGGYYGIQAHEDKKRRLNTWLTQLQAAESRQNSVMAAESIV
jgi:hypothetical protein